MSDLKLILWCIIITECFEAPLVCSLPAAQPLRRPSKTVQQGEAHALTLTLAVSMASPRSTFNELVFLIFHSCVLRSRFAFIHMQRDPRADVLSFVSFPGREPCSSVVCTAPSQGRPLYPVLLHPTPEPGPDLWGQDGGPVDQRGDQWHLQHGSLLAQRTHANTTVAARWVI